MSRQKTIATVILSLLAITPAFAGPGVETFVIATQGQKNNPTGGPVKPVNDNFGNFVGLPSNAVNDPAQLATVGVGGTFRGQTASGNTLLADSLSISGSGPSSFGNWSYNGNTFASVRPGQIKSTSQATHLGNSDNNTTNNAASYGIFTEKLRAVSSSVVNGATGTMRIAMTIDGTMTVTGTGTVGMIFRYDYGAPRPGYPAINRTLLETFANIYGNGYQIYGPHSYLGSFTLPPGMTYDIGAINGNGQPSYITFGGATTVYADVPMTFGLDTEFRMGLLNFTGIGNGNGTMDVLFGNTATMTGVQLFDNRGNEVQDFTLASGSGTVYDRNGVHLGSVAAPEPMSLVLALPLLAIPLRRYRTRQS